MQKRQKRLAMIVAVILAALLIVPAIIAGVIGLLPDANAAVTQKDIDATKKILADLKASKNRAQADINDLKSKQADIIQRKTAYDKQMLTVAQEIEVTTNLIAQINLAIAERQQEIDNAIVEEADLREKYIARVRAMERMGDISYLGILLQAESLTDMLTHWDSVKSVIAHDQSLARQLAEKRRGIESDKAQLEADKREQLDYRKELAATQSELAELSAECDAMISEYVADMVEAEAKMQDVEKRTRDAQKELDEQEAEWKKIQAALEAAKKSNSKYVGGNYLWPVPGYTTISSPFGERIHPVYKVKKMHTGIDIPAPKGTKIIASNTGTVIVKTYSSSYGNYVVLDHGGGQSTLYAHMSSFASISVGSVVSAGDAVGYVGTTGVSTGNHLHFEIRIDGKAVNPDQSGYLRK